MLILPSDTARVLGISLNTVLQHLKKFRRSRLNIAFYMTDVWSLYKVLLSATSHVVSKKYTQRIERNNLNLRTYIKRLTRRTICFSKSAEMHANIIGRYF